MTGLGSSCGACKFLRRRCTIDCVFAPYFCYEQAADHFAAVHRVFGASNASKLLLHLPVHHRSEAAVTISYEALARVLDPVYGCVAHIFALQQQVASLQEEIEILGNEMANLGWFEQSSFGGSVPIDDPICELQSTFLHNNFNTSICLNQETTLLSQATNRWEDQTSYSQVNLQHPAIDELNDQIAQSCLDSNTLVRLLAGMDDGEMFLNCFHMGYGSNILN